MRELLRKTYRLLNHDARRALFLSLFASIVLALLEVAAIGLVLPFLQVIADPASLQRTNLFQRLYDLLGANSTRDFETTLGLVIMALFSIRGVASVAFTWWQTGVLAEAESKMSGDLLAGYLQAPYSMHLKRNSAELIRNVYSSTMSFFFHVVTPFIGIIIDGVVMLLIAALLLVAEPAIAAVTVVFFTAIALVYYYALSRTAMRVGEHTQRFALDAYKQMQQGLEGVKEIQVRGTEEHFADAFRVARDHWGDAKRKQAFVQQLPRYFLETMLIISVVALSIFLLRGRAPGEAIAALGLFGAAGFRIVPSVNRVLAALQAMQFGTAAVNDLYDDVELIEAGRTPPRHEAARLSFQDRILLRGVRFRYEDQPADVLHGLDLEIRRGESVALVGPSGAGKTTLVDILLGLLVPTGGEVLVDDSDLRSHLGEWQRLVAYVPQTIYLLDDTVRRNIAFGVGDGDIDEERVREAVRLAQIDQLVARLPEGLDTEVGERGVRLSGGERQRIGIARALYTRPEVLVLDEATSALDSETESRISATIDDLREQMTLVIVAHRLSTVRSCDRLFLLEDGRVADSGTFDELNRSSDVFAELVRLGALDVGPSLG